jgi:hypothetical protein
MTSDFTFSVDKKMINDLQNENLILKETIRNLEEKLKLSEKRADELVLLSREIAISAVHHVRKVENESAELYALIEEIEEVHVRALERRIAELQNEMRDYQYKEKSYQNSSQSSQRNINELLEKVEKYEKMLFQPDEIITNDEKTTSRTSSFFSSSETSSKRDSKLSIMSRGSSVKNPAFGIIIEARPDIIKEGYMLKKSPAMFKGWQKRYFVLTVDSKLSWFEKVSSAWFD